MKRIILLILLIWGGCSLISAMHQPGPNDRCIDNIWYTFNRDAKTAHVVSNFSTTSTNAGMFTVKIPETIKFDGDTYTVIEILQDAFSDCLFYEIILPKTIGKIGKEAFRNCPHLQNITIPSACKEIGDRAFMCTYSSSYSYPWLRSIVFESSQNPIKIGTDAFYIVKDPSDSALSLLIDRDWTYTQGTSDNPCFTSLTSVKIGDNVTYIPQNSFITPNSARNCNNLSSVELGNSIEKIGEYAFKGCSEISSIKLPDSLKIIYNGAFEGCSKLSEINLPDGLTHLNSNVFENCISLKKIIIPNSTYSFGSNIFKNCTSLEEIILPDNLDHLPSGLCDGCSNLKSLVVPHGVNKVYNHVFNKCEPNEVIFLPNDPPTGLINSGLSNKTVIKVAEHDFNVYQNESYISDNNINVKTFQNPQVTLISDRSNVLLGESVQLHLYSDDLTIDSDKINWECLNPSTAKVDNAGLVSGYRSGSATIKAKYPYSYNNYTAYTWSDLKLDFQQLSQLTFDQETIYLCIDDQYDLKYTIDPLDAPITTVKWTSSNDNIVSVSQTGRLTAHSLGSAEISLRIGDLITKCSVTVSNPTLTIAGDQEVRIWGGRSRTFEAFVVPSNHKLEWGIDNPEIASLSINGNQCVVTGLKGGRTVLTVKSEGGLSASVSIEITGINITPSLSEINIGDKIEMKAALYPEFPDGYDSINYVIWRTSNPQVAVIDSKGTVTGISEGSAIITAELLTTIGEATVIVNKIKPQQIILSDETLILKNGETYNLSASVRPDNVADKSIVWSSSNPLIASIDNYGKVTANSIGEATITATCGSVSTNCKVTVIATPVESITLDKTQISLRAGETSILTATVKPDNANDKTVEWASSNDAVVMVNNRGIITAVSIGEAVITAKCGDVSSTCIVTVVTPAESIVLNQSSASLKVGESMFLTATISPDNATDKTVIWTTSNAQVAVVDENGMVTALKSGNTLITAQVGDLTAICNVTVLENGKLIISLDKTIISLKEGESTTVVPEINAEGDANVVSETWMTSNASVATVSNGIITGISEGSATIAYKVTDNYNETYIAECYVSVEKNDPPTKTHPVTFNLSEYGWSNSEVIGTIPSMDGINISLNKYDGTVDPAFYNSGSAVRMYGGNQLRISASRTIVKVEFEFVSGYNFGSINHSGLSAISVSKGTYSETDTQGEWNLDANEGELYILGTKGSARIKKIIVYIEDSSSEIVKAESITLSSSNMKVQVGETFRLVETVLPAHTTNKGVNWLSSNLNIAIVDHEGKVEVVGEGTCVITAATTDGSNLSAECEVNAVTVSVEEIFAGGGNVDIYSLTGILVKRDADLTDFEQLVPGIYIVKTGDTTHKIVVK